MRRSALRGGLYAVGGLLAAMALLLAFAGAVVPAAWSGFWAALLILVVAFEHWRYKPLDAARPGPDWQATDERFVDPETGKLVTVYFHPATGERRYISR